MASTLENALRLIKPGGMVVSITDILDKLGNKITDAEKEQLLIAMLSPRRDKVQPGDLITSDLLNMVLADVADLQTRMAKMENTQPGSTLTLKVFSIDGPSPIRVGSRVTVNGQNFSTPSVRNSVTLDGSPVDTIVLLSDAQRLVFDVPDPGLSGTGRAVALQVTNADGQNDHLAFRLEPRVVFPSGALGITYKQPPAGGATLGAGDYVFGFNLHAAVDMQASIRFLASIGGVPGWAVRIYRTTGEEITTPVTVPQNSDMAFNVKVTVPSGGASAATMQVSAQETSTGTQVTAAPALEYALTRGGQIPTPESRITVRLESKSNATLVGGTVQFTKGTTGAIDFLCSFDLGTGVTGTTSFGLACKLDDATNAGWSVMGPQPATVSMTGSTSAETRVSLILTPSNIAQATRLSLRITGTPTGQNPVDVTYNIPLLVQ